MKSRKENEVEQQEELLGVQLRHLGLQLRDMPGDGNCLFRALCDQLEGNQENHRRHRIATVNYMIEKRKDFEPFVEDDTTFEDYVNDLRTDGTYAGNDAIVAFAKNNQVDIVIHQPNTRMWTINGGKKNETRRQLHIAYLNGDHYASVRRLNDRMDSPSNIRLISKKNKSSSQRNLKDVIKKIEKATGCQDDQFIQEILEECDNNEEYAISTILQMQKKSKENNDTPSVSSSTKIFLTKKLSSAQSDKTGTKKQRKKDAKRQKKIRAFERKKSELMRKDMESNSSQSEEDSSPEVVFDKMESLKI